jgi:large subunit ribosomal protein L30
MNEEKAKQEPETKAEKPKKEAGVKLAVIRIKGPVKIGDKMNDTLNMLKIYRKHACVVVEKTPAVLGMIKKVQNFVAWGEIDDSTLKELKAKRGEKTKNKDGKEIMKKFFRLSPPKGGFERKGIKVPFALGGAVGYRGDKINALIKRML